MRFVLILATLFLGVSSRNGVCMVRGSHDIDPLEHVRKNLSACLNASQAAQGRDIIVFVGNTGAGKSTYINILAGVRMLPTPHGIVVSEEAAGLGHAAPVNAGFSSITKLPKFFETSSRVFYDLPGFLDTEGMADDILNASAIHKVLTSARSVRMIILARESEFDGARGLVARELDEALRSFEPRFLQSGCCSLVINLSDREDCVENTKDPVASWRANVAGVLTIPQELERLFSIPVQNRFALPKVRRGDGDEFIDYIRRSLTQIVEQTMASKINHLDMSWCFRGEVGPQILDTFLGCMDRYLGTQQSFYEGRRAGLERQAITGTLGKDPVSEILVRIKPREWSEFLQRFERSQEYNLIAGVCGAQYEEARKRFQDVFFNRYDALVSNQRQRELEGQISFQQQCLTKVTQESQQMRTQLDSQSEQTRRLAMRETELSQQAQRLQSSLNSSQAERDRVARDLSSVQQARDSAQRAESDLRSRFNAAESSKSSLEGQIRTLNQQLTSQQSSADSLRTQLSSAQTERDRFRIDVTSQRSRADASAAETRREKEMREAREREGRQVISRHESRIRELETQLKIAHSKQPITICSIM